MTRITGNLRPAICVPAPRLRRRGVAMLYVGILILVLIGFVALAIDFGRVVLARSEVQTAADASAHAAALSLPITTGEVFDSAVDAAFENAVIDAKTTGTNKGSRIDVGVDIDADEDVFFGHWDPAQRQWTDVEQGNGAQDGRRKANAVKVWARRIDERDNPVPLIFAPVLRIFDADVAFGTDVERHAIAFVTGGPAAFGFVGIDWVDFDGATTVDGFPGGTSSTGGGIASDGNIDLQNADVYGDVRAGINGTINQNGSSRVTGWMANLDYVLADLPQYQPRTVPKHARKYTPPTRNNEDWYIPPSTQAPSYDPANPLIYELKDEALDPPGSRDIIVRGYVELYVNGNVGLNNTRVTNDGPNVPGRFTVVVVNPTASVIVGSSPFQYMHLHAPMNYVEVQGGSSTHYYGWIVGRTLRINGNSNLHYDHSKDSGAAYKVRLVE